jgi:hypothetical protein
MQADTTAAAGKWENALDEDKLRKVLDREIDPAAIARPVPL